MDELRIIGGGCLAGCERWNKNPTQQAIEIPPAQRFGAAVRHARPMLSLDKAYSVDEVKSWASKFEEAAARAKSKKR